MLTVRAPAKINLDLRVGPVRADGFHPISSWFVTVGLFDELTFESAERDEFVCSDASLPTDERNLVVRALAAVAHPPLRVTLTKRIPSGGGLGGGSSDAAATLRALIELKHLDADRAGTLAASLGSDVPFFLSPPSALCTGRGEVVTPLPVPGPRAALLFLPPLQLSTPATFRVFDTLPPPPGLHAPGVAFVHYSASAGCVASDLLSTLANDLEPASFSLHPDLDTLRMKLERDLKRSVRMSGSGSTLFTLYDTLAEAEEVAGRVGGCGALAVELCPKV
jgi:4-diphosphocytidyl-2C-methyl-D-erythritol kinase